MTFPVATASSVVRSILEAQVYVAWVTGCGLPAANISWPNTDFTAPENGYWLDIYFRFGTAYVGTLGGVGSGALTDKLGLLSLNFYGPKALGSGAIQAYTNKFYSHFSRQQYSGVETHVEEGPISNTEEAEARMSLSIRFRYWERI